MVMCEPGDAITELPKGPTQTTTLTKWLLTRPHGWTRPDLGSSNRRLAAETDPSNPKRFRYGSLA